jgi:hypothetical protein
MTDQIKIMEEMVQRTELNLQQMQALLAEAKANHVYSKTLSDETIEILADKLSNRFRNDYDPGEVVDMSTDVCGMDITVSLDWSYTLERGLADWFVEQLTCMRDEC